MKTTKTTDDSETTIEVGSPHEFVQNLHKAIAFCIETGDEALLILDTPRRSVEIRIFPAGQDSKKAHEALISIAKDAKIMAKGAI